MSAALREAVQARTAAANRVCAILRRDYPPGREIAWIEDHDTLQTGTVVAPSVGDRVKVRRAKTKREIWVAAADVAEIAP